MNYGEAVSITCAVSRGDQPLEFHWYFKGQQIKSAERQDLSIMINKRRSILEIESVSANHAGEYTCTVSNEAGATSHSTVLAVNGIRTSNVNLMRFMVYLMVSHFDPLTQYPRDKDRVTIDMKLIEMYLKSLGKY